MHVLLQILAIVPYESNRAYYPIKNHVYSAKCAQELDQDHLN